VAHLRGSGLAGLALAALSAAIAAPGLALGSPSDDLIDELAAAAASADTATIVEWIDAHPDRVYLATVRLAERALTEAHRGGSGAAGDLERAVALARIHSAWGGHPGLLHLVERYAAFDPHQIAEHVRADSLHREAAHLYERGHYTQALDLHFQALAHYQNLGNPKGESLEHANIGAVLDLTGETQAAREHVTTSIEIGGEIGCAACLGSGLCALGMIELKDNNLQAAIKAFRRTYQIGLALDESNYIASALAMLANAYYLAGRYHDALAMHQEALDLFRKMGYPAGAVGILINMALIQATDLTQYDRAAETLSEAIEIARSNGFRALEGIALGSLADVQSARGQPRAALETVTRALSIPDLCHDPQQHSSILTTRGRILRDLGRVEEARRGLRQSLSEARGTVSPYALAEMLTQLALAESELGNHRDALSCAQEAIDEFETARGRIGVEELRAGSLYLKTHLYEAALRPLRALHREFPGGGHAAHALHLAEQCKSRTLLDFLASRRCAGEAGRARDVLTEKLSSLQLELLSEAEDDAERASLERRIRTVRAKLDSLEMASLGMYAGARGGAVLTASSIQETLESEGDLLLEYFWGSDTVYVWAVNSHGIEFCSAGASGDLEGLTLIFNSLLRDRDRSALDAPAAQSLSDRLFEPVARGMRRAERLIVIPDGPLLAIPFEALPYSRPGDSGDAALNAAPAKRYLVEAFEVSYAPSASLWRYMTRLAATRTEAQRELLAFGNPSFASTAGGRTWPPLVHSARELAELDRLLSPRRTLIFSGAQASEDRAKAAMTADYRVLHFATHAFASPVDPSASGLLLAPGPQSEGFLTPAEIAGLRLNADLVTLSGCQTGRGRLVSGEGVLGLSRSFFYGGAASVLASLWELDDAHTARFMSRFYERLAGGFGKGRALALVKRDALSGTGGLSTDPCFWAPFVLTGDADGTLSLTPRAWFERAAVWPAIGLVLASGLVLGRLVRRRPRRS